jgi:FkbM family methyltransferase
MNNNQMLRVRLPNNLEIVCQTRVEANYFYHDIFEKRVYLKHGLALRDGDTVFDVGANIGLFTLFVHQQCKNPIVYAFEPAPPLFKILQLNAALYGTGAKLFNYGLSDTSKEAQFTFYPSSSGMSSFYADKQEEKEVLKSIMLNQLRQGVAGMEQLMQHADDLLELRFQSQTFSCQLKRLSDVISQYNVERIDLLKIDVQKSELDVIAGIKEDDWRKIKQLVMEVHDINGRLEHVVDQLQRRGYRVVAEQDDLYEGSTISNVYAAR